MKKEVRALVTAVGTINGSAVVAELKKNNIYTIGANTTPREYVVASKFIDEYYQFPSAVVDKKAYLNFVIQFCVEHKITHIICFIDEEVESFVRNKNLFEKMGVALCLADYITIKTCHFKDQFSDWIEHNLPSIAIKRYLPDQLNKDVLPIFVKPVEGRASMGCHAIISEEELCKYLKKTNNAKNNYIIQELLQGDIVGVDIIRNRKFNQTFIIQKKELMRNSNGCGTVVEIIDDHELRDICNSIAEKLDLNGLVNAEFFITPLGPKIIEINPRLPAGTSYSCLAGGNTVINTIHIANGEPCIYEDIKVGKIYARRYETYEM